MADYIALDEAAKLLGVKTDELVEMISRGDIFGYRDGQSWKFKPTEIERVKMELAGDLFDEDPEGSSLLVSESNVSGGSSKSGLTIGKSEESSEDSDLRIDAEDSAAASDVALVADPNSGSGVRLVNRNDANEGSDSISLGDSDQDIQLSSDLDLNLAEESGLDLAPEEDAMPDLELKDPSGTSSDIDIGDDLKLLSEDGSNDPSDIPLSDLNIVQDSDVLAGSDVAPGSDASPLLGGGDLDAGSSGGLELDDDLAADDEDEIVLGSGSDLALAADSGLNLMSPSESGLSLEDEPLDLAASGISGLDLAGEGSDVENESPSASASGSLVDFQQDEEFQLTPSGGIEAEDDSGSQIIELEDSAEFVDEGEVALDDASEFEDDFGDEGFGDADEAAEGAVAGAAVAASPEVPFKGWELVTILVVLTCLCFSGVILTDIVRNMWAWTDGSQSDLTSGFTQMILSSLGLS